MQRRKNLSPTLDGVIAALPPAERRAVTSRAAELIAEEYSLAELRKALKLTQVDVAKRMAKGQDAVSRIEQRDDLLLSTLSGYVASLGGELELICRFRNRAPVRISTRRLVTAQPKPGLRPPPARARGTARRTPGRTSSPPRRT